MPRKKRIIWKTRCKNYGLPHCEGYFIKKDRTNYCPSCWEIYKKQKPFIKE